MKHLSRQQLTSEEREEQQKRRRQLDACKRPFYDVGEMRRCFPLALIVLLLGLAKPFIACAQQGTLAENSEAAKKALLAGNYKKAVALYRKLTAALPENPGLRLDLGLALEKAGQASEAVPELQKASQKLPESAPVWFLLGLAYQQLHRPKLAVAPLRKAVRLEGSNEQARFELADAELVTGQAPAAIADFETLTQKNPSSPKAWQGLGMAYITLSENFFARIDSSYRGTGYWYALLARSQAAAQHYGEALELYRKALQKTPAMTGIHAACAEIYRETGHDRWAEVERANAGQRHKPDCTVHEIECAFAAQDWKRVLADLGSAPTAEALYWATLSAQKLADQSLQRLAALPPSPETHEILAESYQREGHRMEAIHQWRRALAMQPGDRRLRGKLAESLVRARKYDEAGKLLAPLVRARPDNAEWQYFFGKVLFEQGRPKEALPHLITSVRLLPRYLPAQETLGRVYLALRDPQQAIPHLKQALTLDADGSVSFALSTAYRRLNQVAASDLALARYRKLSQKKNEVTPLANPGEIPPPITTSSSMHNAAR